ncbi:MAG: hypothetical protein J2P37_06210 [Ktedonobacteraceae bacterium]|nr:hypothetical protein [Ktedonobacteraceae bacterium]MBO0793709.1 hypothetical protein [Ktedonobacteraceae bacterium]
MQNGNSQEIQRERIVTSSQQMRRCACCEIEFPWPPVVVGEAIYCCTGCAAGGPCNCDYSQYRSVNISGVIHYGSGRANGSDAPQEKPEQA